MNDFANANKPLSQHGQDADSKPTDATKDGIRSAQDATDEGIDKAFSKAVEVRVQAAQMLGMVSDQAQKLVEQGRDALRDTSQLVRDKASQASDTAVGYTKDEPMKAILLAAAAGAVLMGLVTLLARSRD